MKKIGLLVLTLVLALGALGIGYAAWQQTLTISGNADTASFDVHFEPTVSATPIVSSTNNAGHLDIKGSTYNSITVDLVNGFPNFGGECSYQIHNNGSVNVKINHFEYRINGGDWQNWGDGYTTAAIPINSDQVAVLIRNYGIASGDLIPVGAINNGRLSFVVTGTSTDGPVAAAHGTFGVRFIIDQKPN